jgi:glycosyltransferase involved in cell wall biosynthesis
MRSVESAELVVVGGLPPEPDLDRLKDLAARLSLEDRVRFRGFVPPPSLATERAKTDVFVIPLLDSTTARLFTSPLKLFEAMASGRPVVASDLPAIREILEHERNALLVPPGDARALAAAVERLLRDSALSAKLAARAFEDVKAYSWDRRAQAIEDFLRHLEAPS